MKIRINVLLGVQLIRLYKVIVVQLYLSICYVLMDGIQLLWVFLKQQPLHNVPQLVIYRTPAKGIMMEMIHQHNQSMLRLNKEL